MSIDDLPMPAGQYIISVSSHVSVNARMNWFPWTDKPLRASIGWQGDPHDGGPPIYCYLVPDLLASRPLIRVHLGRTGDPDRDPVVHTVEVT